MKLIPDSIIYGSKSRQYYIKLIHSYPHLINVQLYFIYTNHPRILKSYGSKGFLTLKCFPAPGITYLLALDESSSQGLQHQDILPLRKKNTKTCLLSLTTNLGGISTNHGAFFIPLTTNSGEFSLPFLPIVLTTAPFELCCSIHTHTQMNIFSQSLVNKWSPTVLIRFFFKSGSAKVLTICLYSVRTKACEIKKCISFNK